jgi:hypothetical protein
MTVSGGAIATVGGVGAVVFDNTNATTIANTTFTVVTKGSGYAVAPAVRFTGGTGTSPVAPVATAVLGGTNGAQVVGVRFTSLGSGYTTAPTMSFSTGSGFAATASLKDGAILYNEASQTYITGNDNTSGPTGTAYTLDVDRTKPVSVWKAVAAGSTALRSSVSLVDNAVFPATGNYVLLSSTTSATTFTIRAVFSSPMNRTLRPTDLNLVGCSLDPTYDTDGILDVGGAQQTFDIKVLRGGAPASVTVMSVAIKAAPSYDADGAGPGLPVILSDNASPAQTSLASTVFTANVVTVPSAPIIKTLIGVEGTPSRTVSYPCTVTFSSAVTGFLPSHLSVTNGVISKFSGSGKSYSFTLTPGEGLVSVKYLATSGLTDVAGQSVPNSNDLRRTLDSTQPMIEVVASPMFGQSGAVKPISYTPVVVGGVNMVPIPVRITFSEAPKTVPTTSVLATVLSSTGATPATFISGAGVTIQTPTVVSGTANKTYSMNLLIPATGSGSVRLVVPALGVPDNATNQSAASSVYLIEYNYASGTEVDVGAGATYSNG